MAIQLQASSYITSAATNIINNGDLTDAERARVEQVRDTVLAEINNGVWEAPIIRLFATDLQVTQVLFQNRLDR